MAPPWNSLFPRASRASMRMVARSPAAAPASPCPESRHIGRLTSCASTSTTSGLPTTASPLTVATISCRPTSHHRTAARYRDPRSANVALSVCDAPDGVMRCIVTASCPLMPRPVTSYSSACRYTSLVVPHVARSVSPGPGRIAQSDACRGPYVAITSTVDSFATRPFTAACITHRPAAGATNVHPYVPSPWSTTSTALARAPVGPCSTRSTWSPPPWQLFPNLSSVCTNTSDGAPRSTPDNASPRMLARDVSQGPGYTCNTRGEHAHGMSSTETATVYDPARGRTPRRPARPPRTSTTSNARSAGFCAGPCATTAADSPLQTVALPNRSRASTRQVISSPAIATATPKAAAAAPGPFVAPVMVCRLAVHPTCEIFPAFMTTSMGNPGAVSPVSTHVAEIL